MAALDMIHEQGAALPVAARSDVLVVGGGPAGQAAAIAARRIGVSVTLVERYPYLGGLASGGMVLVLDDMTNSPEITVTGICMEMIGRRKRIDAGSTRRPRTGDRARRCGANGRAGAFMISGPRRS